MNRERYSGIATINHWIAALLVTAMFLLGLLAYWAPGEEAEDFIMEVHIGLGFFVFLFIAWRVGYRLYEGFPAGIERTKFERGVAWAVHRLLLLAIAVMVVTGPLYLFTEGEGVDVFGWFTVYIPLEWLSVIHEPTEWVHVNLGLYLLPTLVVIHLLGAVRHFWNRRGETPADM